MLQTTQHCATDMTIRKEIGIDSLGRFYVDTVDLEYHVTGESYINGHQYFETQTQAEKFYNRITVELPRKQKYSR